MKIKVTLATDSRFGVELGYGNVSIVRCGLVSKLKLRASNSAVFPELLAPTIMLMPGWNSNTPESRKDL